VQRVSRKKGGKFRKKSPLSKEVNSGGLGLIRGLRGLRFTLNEEELG
jgi:hypothetical protein